MFREMRRIRQQLTEKECKDILSRNTALVMAVQGDKGYPYAVPLSYVYVDGTIFLHGAKDGYKTDCIKRSDKVCLTIIDQNKVVPEELTSYFRSVIIFGKAKLLTEPLEAAEALKKLGIGFYPNEDRVMKSVNRNITGNEVKLSMIKVEIEHMTGKQAIALYERLSFEKKPMPEHVIEMGEDSNEYVYMELKKH